MEKLEQTPTIMVDPAQILEMGLILTIEAWYDLQAVPSWVEENARVVRKETLDEFASWFHQH